VDFTRQYLSNSKEKCLRLLVALTVASVSLGLLFALLEKKEAGLEMESVEMNVSP